MAPPHKRTPHKRTPPKISPPKIAIAGDGIAAEAMGLAFARRGIPATIIGEAKRGEHTTEGKTSAPTTEGGIQLAPNAWAALDALGVREAAQSHALPLTMMRLLGLESGISLVSLPLNDRPKRTPYTSMARGDLAAILAEASGETGLVGRIQGRLTAIESTGENTGETTGETTGGGGGQIRLKLNRGKPLEADWLFGCDGQNGLCRHYLEAGAPLPRHHHRDALRLIVGGDEAGNIAGGVAPGEPPRGEPPRGGWATTVWLGRGGHVVQYPLPDGRLNLVAVVPPSPRSPQHAGAMLARQPLLADLADGIAAAKPIALYDHAPLGAWQRGRVVLAGDAAHPMPPHLAQGAGQGLVDAAAMMRHLGDFGGGADSGGADSGGDALQPIITAWCAERMRATRRISRDARRAGALFALNAPLARVRDTGLGAVGDIGLGLVLDRLWSA